MNGEIQIIPHNNAAKHVDQSAGSTQWRAILQDGTLTAPGAANTLKFDNTVAGDGTLSSHKVGGTLILSTTREHPLYTGGEVDSYFGYQDLAFASLAAKSGVTIPMLLKILGIAPPGGELEGDHLWLRNYGERLPFRGGNLTSSARVACSRSLLIGRARTAIGLLVSAPLYPQSRISRAHGPCFSAGGIKGPVPMRRSGRQKTKTSWKPLVTGLRARRTP